MKTWIGCLVVAVIMLISGVVVAGFGVHAYASGDVSAANNIFLPGGIMAVSGFVILLFVKEIK